MFNTSAIKQTLLYGVSVSLMRGVSLLMLPFYAHHLSPEDFGHMEILSSIAMFGSVIVGLGLEEALYRFTATKSVQKRAKTAAGVFTLALLSGLIFSIFIYPLSQAISVIAPGNFDTILIIYILAMLAMEGVIAVPLGWLRIINRPEWYCALCVGRVILQALLTVIFLQNGQGLHGIFLASLIAAGSQAFVLFVIQTKSTGLYLNVPLIRSILIYSSPIIGSGLLAFGLNGFDRWMIAKYVSMEELAMFGIAAKFSIGLVILMQPFGMWWTPRRQIELTQENGKERILHFSTIGILLLAGLVIFVGLIAPVLITLLLPDEYSDAIYYTYGLIIVVALKEITEIINIGCFTQAKTNTQLYINITTTIFACTAIVVSIPHYHIYGVIVSLALAQFIRMALFYVASQRVVYLHYPTLNLSVILATSFILIATSTLWLYANVSPWIELGLLLSTMCAMITLVIFFGSAIKKIFAASGKYEEVLRGAAAHP